MTTDLHSPFARPDPDLRIKEGAPPLLRPEKKDFFPEAQHLIQNNCETQKQLMVKHKPYDLSWLEGRHILVAGGTGPGVGCAIATAILEHGKAASLTVLARDLSRSLNYETGRAMQVYATKCGWNNRFHWIPEGMALQGKAFEKLITVLKDVAAQDLVVINTVAAAMCGLQPGQPPIFVRDIDDEGVFQWQLRPLSDTEIHITRMTMGEMAVQFPTALADHGVSVATAVFSDWRGSLDLASRNPSSDVYGRQGAYSTSLFLPKDIIHNTVSQRYGNSKCIYMDIFLPTMRTRALPLIPGGVLMASVFETLMNKTGVPHKSIPELGLDMLDTMGRNRSGTAYDPYPRLDLHEAQFDGWFFELAPRLTNDERSPFYFKHWVSDQH